MRTAERKRSDLKSEMQHGDPILSGAIILELMQQEIPAAVATENVEKRPSCGYSVKNPAPEARGGTIPCGSQQDLYSVKGTGTHGWLRETPVCGKHINDAWKNWKVESAERMKP